MVDPDSKMEQEARLRCLGTPGNFQASSARFGLLCVQEKFMYAHGAGDPGECILGELSPQVAFFAA